MQLPPLESGLCWSPCLPSLAPASSHGARCRHTQALAGTWVTTRDRCDAGLYFAAAARLWLRTERQPAGTCLDGATRFSSCCGYLAPCRHKGMAYVGVTCSGERAGRSAIGKWSQECCCGPGYPEEPFPQMGAVGDLCLMCLCSEPGHGRAEERCPLYSPWNAAVGSLRGSSWLH